MEGKLEEKIIIIGAIGSAKVIGEQINDAYVKWNTNQEFIGYAFDDESFGGDVNGFPILSGTRTLLEKYQNDASVKFLYQLYRPDVISERVVWREKLKIPQNKWATFIHPLSSVAASAKIGYGSTILSFSTINANAQIGPHCTLQAGCTIGHDAVVGCNNFFASQTVIGNCTIGDNNFFGLNSNTNNFIEIGDDCFIAMGSNVVKSAQNNEKLMGNPAKSFNTKIRRI